MARCKPTRGVQRVHHERVHQQVLHRCIPLRSLTISQKDTIRQPTMVADAVTGCQYGGEPQSRCPSVRQRTKETSASTTEHQQATAEIESVVLTNGIPIAFNGSKAGRSRLAKQAGKDSSDTKHHHRGLNIVGVTLCSRVRCSRVRYRFIPRSASNSTSGHHRVVAARGCPGVTALKGARAGSIDHSRVDRTGGCPEQKLPAGDPGNPRGFARVKNQAANNRTAHLQPTGWAQLSAGTKSQTPSFRSTRVLLGFAGGSFGGRSRRLNGSSCRSFRLGLGFSRLWRDFSAATTARTRGVRRNGRHPMHAGHRSCRSTSRLDRSGGLLVTAHLTQCDHRQQHQSTGPLHVVSFPIQVETARCRRPFEPTRTPVDDASRSSLRLLQHPIRCQPASRSAGIVVPTAFIYYRSPAAGLQL